MKIGISGRKKRQPEIHDIVLRCERHRKAVMPSLRVCINGSEAPTDIDLPQGSQVCHLRAAVLAGADARNEGRNVRVIANGKVLCGERILSSPSILACGLIHCAIATPSPSFETGGGESGSFTRIDVGAASSELLNSRGRLEWTSGFVVGLFFGFVMVIIAMDKSIGMTGRWHSGLVCGVTVNIIFGVVLLVRSGF